MITTVALMLTLVADPVQPADQPRPVIAHQAIASVGTFATTSRGVAITDLSSQVQIHRARTLGKIRRATC